MPIKVTCPKCQGVLHAPDDAGGKKGKCPTCGTVLAIPDGGSSVAPPRPVGTPSAVPAGGGRLLGEAQGYGLMPPGGEVRQSSVPMLPRPGDGTKPSPGFGAPPPAKAAARPRPAVAPTDAGDEVRSYRRARRGLGLVQAGQFLMLLAGIAGPAVAIGRLYGLKLPDTDPGYLKKPGLPAAAEIEYAAVLVPLALGLLLLVFGRVGFGNVPRSSFARGPAKWAGLFTLLAVGGLVAYAAMAGNAMLSSYKPVFWPDNGNPRLQLLQTDELPGRIQVGGLLLFGLAAFVAEACFVSAVGRLASNLRHDTAAGRHTRFLLLAHLGAGLIGVWFVLRVIDPALYEPAWTWVSTTWDDLLGKTGAARPALVYGLMAVPSVVVWFLYARLTGGARRAVGDWLAAHDG